MNAQSTAEQLGRRAGETLREWGIPSRCPFRDLAALRAAWARGYDAGFTGRRR